MITNQTENSRAIDATPVSAADHIDTSFDPNLNKGKRRVVAASTLTGDRVRNAEGDALGTIDEIMLDPESGRVVYAVLSYGGFLGIGDKLFAVPWEALQTSANDGEFILDADPKVLESAPGFDKDNWPDMADESFGSAVYKHYGREPYWDKRVTDAGDFTGAEHSPDTGMSSSKFDSGTRH